MITTWSSYHLVRAYQPRPGDASKEQFARRIEACRGCALRRINVCSQAGEIVSVMARQAKGRCPAGKWPGEQAYYGPMSPTAAPSQPQKPIASEPDGFEDTTIAVTCLYRFDLLETLLKSIRRFYPQIGTVVADNSFTLEEYGSRDFCRLRELCCRWRADLVLLPHNVGCAATRNHAVLACRTPYVIVCEEDFEFTRETDLEKLLRAIRNGQADCVGGLERYTDPTHSFHERPNPPGYDGVINTFQWTANIEFKGEWGRRELVVTQPDVNDMSELSGVICRKADLIHNFYAIRREVYQRAPNDIRCKVDEHLDHFLRLRAIAARVYYTPEVVVDHHSRAYRSDSSDPLEAKFAKVRNTGGQYHKYVRENWGLDPEKKWGLGITKVPYVDRRKAPVRFYLPADHKPNIIVLTCGRTGSGILVRQLVELGWQANGTREQFGEIPALYELNERILKSGDPSRFESERDRFLAHLKTPWVLKDPRMVDLWEFWLTGIRKRFADPLVIWSVRNPVSVRASFNAAGWSRAPWEERLERARAVYEAYAGAKVIVEHEQMRAAVQSWNWELADRVSVGRNGHDAVLRS